MHTSTRHCSQQDQAGSPCQCDLADALDADNLSYMACRELLCFVCSAVCSRQHFVAVQHCPSRLHELSAMQCAEQGCVTVQHFPARLHQLYLVDLPVVLKWVVSAVKPVLQVETRGKIQVCQLPSPLFPFPDSLLDFSASQKRVSLPSAALSRLAQQQVSCHHAGKALSLMGLLLLQACVPSCLLL